MPSSTSFPSGHAAAAFAFATGVGHVLPAAAIPLRGLAALVGYSRVHTGVHYPGDVVAGALMGTALAQFTTHALDRRTAHRE
jgi:undecaprenyl-diphosphatase